MGNLDLVKALRSWAWPAYSELMHDQSQASGYYIAPAMADVSVPYLSVILADKARSVLSALIRSSGNDIKQSVLKSSLFFHCVLGTFC